MMLRRSTVHQIDDRVSSAYDEAYAVRTEGFASTPKYESELRRVARLVSQRPGGTWLDVGCNTGAPTAWLDENSEARFIGTDFAAAASAWWSHRAPQFVRADAHNLPFRTNSLAGACMMHSIGHVLRPDVVASEVLRVLAPGGVVVIVTPNSKFVRWMKPLNWARIVSYSPDPTVLRRFNRRSIGRLLSSVGFRSVTCEIFGDTPKLARFLGPIGKSARERLLASGVAPGGSS